MTLCPITSQRLCPHRDFIQTLTTGLCPWCSGFHGWQFVMTTLARGHTGSLHSHLFTKSNSCCLRRRTCLWKNNGWLTTGKWRVIHIIHIIICSVCFLPDVCGCWAAVWDGCVSVWTNMTGATPVWELSWQKAPGGGQHSAAPPDLIRRN